MMRRKRGNTNIKILQSQLQDLVVENKLPINENKLPINDTKLPIPSKPIVISGGAVELPIIEKIPKKRGIKKDELINTRRLLTI